MFARHETFHPRYGWFRKAYRFAAADPHVFSREDAPVRIGVGKNMVRAIRFWGLAAKLIEEKERTSKSRASEWIPTALGDALFGESGWDRYMEDPGTLWLLHWLLLAPPSLLPVWWIAFNDFPAVEFDDDDLVEAVGGADRGYRGMECAASIVIEERCGRHAAYVCAGRANRGEAVSTISWIARSAS